MGRTETNVSRPATGIKSEYQALSESVRFRTQASCRNRNKPSEIDDTLVGGQRALGFCALAELATPLQAFSIFHTLFEARLGFQQNLQNRLTIFRLQMLKLRGIVLPSQHVEQAFLNIVENFRRHLVIR